MGILKEGFQGKDSDVDQLVRSAAYRLREAGAEVEEVSIPIHLKGKLGLILCTADPPSTLFPLA